MGKKKSAPKEPAKIKVRPMELFRAQDRATKQVLTHMTEDAYVNCLSKVGIGAENALSSGTYDFDLITRNRMILEMAYRGSWMSGAVIDSVSDDMTREGVDVTTSEGENQIEDFKNYFNILQIFSSLNSGLKWGRLYGGAIGLIDIDGQDISKPLRTETVSKGQFKGVQVYDRWMINPILYPLIKQGPDAGLPMYYQIVSSLDSMDPMSGVDGQLVVHHSRVFRFGAIKLPYFQAITEMMWDESVLERLWDRLIAFDNATMSAASLVDVANLRTISMTGFREILAAGSEAMAGFRSRMEVVREYQTNMGLTILDKDDQFTSTSYSFTGLPESVMIQGQQLSGASQIPLVRLFGQSPAGLNSTGDSDIRLYYDGIKAKQESGLRNPFTKLLKVMWQSAFGLPAPKDLNFTFTPLWQVDSNEKADIAQKNTATIISAYESGLIKSATAMRELRAQSAQTGLFANITDEDIEEADLEPPPLPDAANGVQKEEPEIPKEKTTDSVKSNRLRSWLRWK